MFCASPIMPHAHSGSCSGYGCNDHFYEEDTILHSWEVSNPCSCLAHNLFKADLFVKVLAQLLQAEETQGIIGDVGMCAY